MRLSSLGALVLSLATSSCIPSIKSAFVDMSYPKDPTQSAERNVALSFDAELSASLLVAYERPHQAGACLAEIAKDNQQTTALWHFGECMAGGGSRLQCLPRLPFVAEVGGGAPFSLRFSCATPPATKQDQLTLALALDDASVTAVNYQLTALGPSALHTPPSPALSQAFHGALTHGAQLLQADPRDVHDTNEPALSLSGGAANGAFVAGFLYALLWTREQALFYGSAPQKADLAHERFGSAFGSSVGSLIGLPLDLYFTDASPAPSLAPAIDACVREGSGRVAARSDRPLQDCALALLEHDFVANEWELLCAQPGSALDLLTPSAKSLLRFDPLEQGHITPFLESFGVLTRDNAFVRTVTAVDLEQSVLGVLDERACRMPGMSSDQCVREGVLASVSEPVLAPARGRTYSGLMGPGGEAGHWLDGGLESVNPAARAVGFTNGKVLAVNTFRALGTPVRHIEGLAPTTLGAMTVIPTRMIGWETSYAALEQQRRRAHACELGKLVGNDALCHASAPGAGANPAPETPGLLSVSVPDDISPASLFATGFTFDPVVMRGLFIWGERAMLRSRSQIFKFLDWCVPQALERPDAVCPGREGQSPAYVAAIRALEQRVGAEIDSYQQYERPGVWPKHIADRKALVSKNLKTCEH